MSSGWSLRMKKPDNQPFIGKFSESVNLSDSKQPVYMYLKDEEIREDESELQDSETYKKKRLQRRNTYTKKSVLNIEDSSLNQVNQLRFEGRLCDTSLEDSTIQSNNNENNNSLFRYALLQVIPGNNNIPTEVHVIPVNNIFAFRKPTLHNDKLLDEIDDDYDTQIRLNKEKMKRYRKIGKVLDESSNTVSDNNKTVENGQSDNFVIPALFGSVAKKSKGKGQKVLLSESGIDMDLVYEENNNFSGDYKASFADDDEELVAIEQNNLNVLEDEFIARKDNFNYDDDDDDENDDEKDESSENTISDTGIAGINADELERSTRMARLAIISDDSISNKKRDRDEEISPNNANSDAIKRQKTDSPNSLPIYPPNEDGLKAYAISMGGKVTTSQLKEVFKSQLKAEAKRLGDKKLAQSIFIDNIAKVFKQQDEQGLVLILK